MNKIKSLVATAKSQQKTIVLATGVFDLFHEEHLQFLKKAQAAGDVLLVGVESDKRVRQLKGAGRPIQDEDERLQQVSHFPGVDYAFLLPVEFDQPAHHLELLKVIQPDVLAVSSHTSHLDKKQHLMSQLGGRVEVVHQHNPQISTTQLIEEKKKK